MSDAHDVPVVLLYVHELLGQGIAQHVSETTGVDVIAVPACDAEAVARALATGPRVIIYERCPLLDEMAITTMAPQATFIDVTAAIGPLIPSPSEPPQVETIVRAVVASGAGAWSPRPT